MIATRQSIKRISRQIAGQLSTKPAHLEFAEALSTLVKQWIYLFDTSSTLGTIIRFRNTKTSREGDDMHTGRYDR